jgi:ABC-2 type transport system permease protein
MRAAAALAGAELRRVTRDRTFLFFMVLLPILIILLIGITISSNEQIRVGVVNQGQASLSTSLARELADDPALTVETLDSRTAASEALRRSEVSAAVVIPAGFDASLRAGETVTVPVLVPGTAESSQAALAAIQAVVGRHAATVQAAGIGIGRIESCNRLLTFGKVLHGLGVEDDRIRHDSARW